MITSHTTDKCANFKRFVRDKVVKGVISLNEEQMHILELTDLNNLLRSRMMQGRRPILMQRLNVDEMIYLERTLARNMVT
jgi:hypothetical protein